jgi:YD repeat-containing protein
MKFVRSLSSALLALSLSQLAFDSTARAGVPCGNAAVGGPSAAPGMGAPSATVISSICIGWECLQGGMGGGGGILWNGVWYSAPTFRTPSWPSWPSIGSGGWGYYGNAIVLPPYWTGYTTPAQGSQAPVSGQPPSQTTPAPGGSTQPKPGQLAGARPVSSKPSGSTCKEDEYEDDDYDGPRGSCGELQKICKKLQTAPDTIAGDSMGSMGSDVSAYTGSGQVAVEDVALFGGVGGDALDLDRLATTRTNSMNITRGAFGRESPWTHNYQWFMRDAGPLNGQPRISIAFPSGGDYVFTRNATFPSVWDASAGTGMSLSNTGNDFVLQLSDASTYNFKRLVNATTGAVSYRIESYSEEPGLNYVFTYNNATDTLIRKVTEPAGRSLTFTYQNVGSFQVQRVALGEIAYQSPAGQWIEVPVTNTTNFRYLTAFYTNDWRDAPPVPVGELEFYDENNQLITGTAFASDPLFQDDPQNPNDAHSGPKAFDGDTSTYYQYAYQRNGYVGIDAGAGKKVSKVRIFVTGAVPGVDVVGRLQFFGMNETGSANWVVKEVKTSDNRSTIYDYSVFNDPSGFFRWVILDQVRYDDGTIAHYTYQQTHDFSPPQLIETQDPRQSGKMPSIRFDYEPDGPLGFVARTVNPLTMETIATMGSDGEHKPKVVFADGRITKAEYTDGRLTKSIDGLGKATTFTHDANGYVASATDALLRTTTWTRDAWGHELTATHPDGLVETWTRDAAGRPLTYTLSGPATTARTTTYARDAAGRVTRIDYPDATFESWTYNSQGLVLTHTAVNGGTHTWNYGPTGLLTSEVNALGGTTTYTHDAMGRVSTVTDTVNLTTSYIYKPTGRIQRITSPNGDFKEFGYDDFGNVISETDQATNSKTYEYNTFRLITKITDALNRSVLYEYGAASGGGGCSCNTIGKPTLITYPDGRQVRNVYDKEWRLISSTAGYGTPLARTVTYTYDAVGNKTKQTNPDTTFTAWTYDNMDRVATIKDKASTATTGFVSLTYDLFDNVLTRTSVTGGVTAYEYDLMNRPVKTTDALGKITETTSHPDGKVKTVKDPLNRVT